MHACGVPLVDAVRAATATPAAALGLADVGDLRPGMSADAVVVDDLGPDDLAATMFHLLGIDPHTEVFDAQNRPLPIARGEPITGLLA